MLNVADSPVVPTAIITSVLFSIWNSTNLSSELKSRDPSVFIGVAIATILPLNSLKSLLMGQFVPRPNI